MAWNQVGQLPFYGANFPYFDEINGAMIIAGGRQNSTPSFALSAAVWRSVDGVNWNRIDNDLSHDHDQGSGYTIQGKAYAMGGGVNIERGKLTSQWDVTATTSIKGTQIRWGSAGSGSTVTSIMTHTRFNKNLAAFGLRNNGTLLYKKEITKGGAPWRTFVSGDAIPSGLLKDNRLHFNGTTVILPPSFVGGIPIPHWRLDTGGPSENLTFMFVPSIHGVSTWWSFNGFEWMRIATPGNLPPSVRDYSDQAVFASQRPATCWLIGVGSTQREVWISSNAVNWTFNSTFPVAIRNGNACIFNGEVYVAGGIDPNTGNMYNKVWKLS